MSADVDYAVSMALVENRPQMCGCARCASVASEDRIFTDLLQLWASTVSATTLDAQIAAAIECGLDGEHVAWEVIIRESTRHLGLVNKEISKLLTVLPDTDPADLIGYGWRGLRVALRQYDPDRGFSFSTFACPKINGAIRDGVRSEHHLPKRLTTFARKVHAAQESLSRTLSRTPTFDDIAAYLDADAETMRLAARLGPSASLEELSDVDTGTRSVPAALVEPTDVATAAVLAVRDADVRDAVAALEPCTSALLSRVFFTDMTLTAAAAELGLEVRTARALRDEGLASLRARLGSWATVAA